MSHPVPVITVHDLVGAPYAERGTCARDGLDCWGLARIVMSRLNVHLPREPAQALADDLERREWTSRDPLGACRVGDVLILEGGEAGGGNPREHLGVALGSFQFIHATRVSGVRVDRMDVWQRSGKIRRVLRARALGGDAGT